MRSITHASLWCHCRTVGYAYLGAAPAAHMYVRHLCTQAGHVGDMPVCRYRNALCVSQPNLKERSKDRSTRTWRRSRNIHIVRTTTTRARLLLQRRLLRDPRAGVCESACFRTITGIPQEEERQAAQDQKDGHTR
jgi:hypothetical protein